MRTAAGGGPTYARTEPPRNIKGNAASAPVRFTSTRSPGKNPGAETSTVIVAVWRPWVKVSDSGEREIVTPGVVENAKLETGRTSFGRRPSPWTRISKRTEGVA